MTWAEIEDQFWNITGDRMKNRDPQRVPLCPMALEVIEQAKAYSGGCSFVFCSSHKPDSPISRQAITRAVSRHWSEMGINEPFTPHDLRRTLRTKLAELAVTDVVAERVLGHKLQGLLAVYNQHGYDTEKRQALARWEQRLREIIGPSESIQNVILFGVRHG